MSLKIYEGNFAVMGQQEGNQDSGTGRKYEGKVSNAIIVYYAIIVMVMGKRNTNVKQANRGQIEKLSSHKPVYLGNLSKLELSP